jgi:excreted virulence factor EspC (type VII ESX diderm)
VAGGNVFGVQADALLGHASAVDAVADKLRTARAAGAHVTIGRGAYGKLPPCQLIASLVDPIQGYGVDALAAAADGLTTTADALRTAARRYLSTDDGVRQRFHGGGLR